MKTQKLIDFLKTKSPDSEVLIDNGEYIANIARVTVFHDKTHHKTGIILISEKAAKARRDLQLGRRGLLLKQAEGKPLTGPAKLAEIKPTPTAPEAGTQQAVAGRKPAEAPVIPPKTVSGQAVRLDANQIIKKVDENTITNEQAIAFIKNRFNEAMQGEVEGINILAVGFLDTESLDPMIRRMAKAASNQMSRIQAGQELLTPEKLAAAVGIDLDEIKGFLEGTAVSGQIQAKQPWEMTKKEFMFAERKEDMRGAGGYSMPSRSVKFLTKQHRDIIGKALSESEPVPREVLLEYKGQDWADEALAKKPTVDKIAEKAPKVDRVAQAAKLEPVPPQEPRLGSLLCLYLSSSIVGDVGKPKRGKMRNEVKKWQSTRKN